MEFYLIPGRGRAWLADEQAATEYPEARKLADEEIPAMWDQLAGLIVGLGRAYAIGGETVEMEIGGDLRCVAPHYCSHCREVHHDGEGECVHKELAAALAL